MNPHAALRGLRFTKMQGAGNDFVLIDARARPLALSPEAMRWIADRRSGVGFDQLLSVEPPRSPGAALYYGIWNTDGSPAGQCGNGARCVAAWARRAGFATADEFRMDSPSGPVDVQLHADDDVEISLGVPDFRARALPARGVRAPDGVIEVDGAVHAYRGVSMGNPHALIEVVDVDSAPVAAIGAALQADARFPDSVNVGFAQVLGAQHIRLRVYERGVGETLACGSGACAAVALLHARHRVDACAGVRVDLPGGRLQIQWPGAGHAVRMRGPAVFVFEGEFCP
jgi:diaminopimelate epimerase